MNYFDRAYPISFIHPRDAGNLPSWPVVSIVLLLLLSVLFQPWLVTVLNLCLLFLALFVWSASSASFDRNLIYTAGPFAAIVLFGMTMGIDADRYLYLKDLWYVSNPPVIISVGYVLYCCKPDLARGLRAFVIGGTLLALVYLVPVAVHPEILSYSSNQIRGAIGLGFYAPVLAFFILTAYFGKWSEGLRLPPRMGGLCLVICSVAMMISMSRMTLLLAVIGLLAATGVFARREWLRLGLVALVAGSLFFALRAVVDLGEGTADGAFLAKLLRSFDEVSIGDYSDARSINLNWRGFETARALKLFFSGEPLQWFIGHGFGTQVGLGAVWMGTMKQIPVLHNGYAYLLVKGGAIAVLLYGFSLSWFYLTGRRQADSANGQLTCASARVLQAIAVGIAVATWFISGVFNKTDMFPLLLAAGFLLAALTRKTWSGMSNDR